MGLTPKTKTVRHRRVKLDDDDIVCLLKKWLGEKDLTVDQLYFQVPYSAYDGEKIAIDLNNPIIVEWSSEETE